MVLRDHLRLIFICTRALYGYISIEDLANIWDDIIYTLESLVLMVHFLVDLLVTNNKWW